MMIREPHGWPTRDHHRYNGVDGWLSLSAFSLIALPLIVVYKPISDIFVGQCNLLWKVRDHFHFLSDSSGH
jgi:hypothetical protein